MTNAFEVMPVAADLLSKICLVTWAVCGIRSTFLAEYAGLGKGLEWAASVSSKSAVKTELGKYVGHLKDGKLLRNSVEPIWVVAVANSWGN